MSEVPTMEQSPSKSDCPDDPGSFKGQMAARYKERQSMGFHLSRSDNQGEYSSCPDPSTKQPDQDNLQTALTGIPANPEELVRLAPNARSDIPKQSMSLGVQGKVGGRSEECGDDRSAVHTRRSMRDLITQFEKRSSTALDSPHRDFPSSTPPTGGSSRRSGTGLATTPEVAEGSLAREAWRGSNRALNMELDTMAVTSSSSSVSLSDVSADTTETFSLRGSKRNPRKAKDGRLAKVMRSASSTDLETTGFGVSGGAARKEADTDKKRAINGGVASKVLVSSEQSGVDSGLSDAWPPAKNVGHGGDQANIGTQDTAARSQEENAKRKIECEVLEPEQEREPTKAQTTDSSQAQVAGVPQPLRVNLKDFAARKKRSSNGGEMKYVVHRKDWKKWMQSHQTTGTRQKQPGGFPEALTASKSLSLQHARKSALEFRFLQRSSSRESKVDSFGCSDDSSKKKVTTSASNTQQRLERRASQRSLTPSPAVDAMPSGLITRPEIGMRKPTNAMERYQLFLNRTSRQAQDAKYKHSQHQPPESQSSQHSPSGFVSGKRAYQPGRSEVEGGPQTSITFPGFSLPPSTLSPRRRKDGSRQALQALLKKAREKDQRHQSTLTRRDNEERRSQSTLSYKRDGSDLLTPSTGSCVSNANTTSTVELEQQMDRVLAQLEEVTAAKGLKSRARGTEKGQAQTHSFASGPPLKTMAKALERQRDTQPKTFSEVASTGKMEESVNKDSKTVSLAALRANEKQRGGQTTLDILLSGHDVIAGRHQRSLTPTVTSEYLHQLAFRSISPWKRSSQGEHPVKESRSRSSPASFRRNAHVGTTARPDTSKLEEQIAVSLANHVASHVDRRVSSDQYQSQLNRHKPHFTAKPRMSPSLDMHNIRGQNPYGAAKQNTVTEDLLKRDETSKGMADYFSSTPTTLNLTRAGPFSSQSYQVFSSEFKPQTENLALNFTQSLKEKDAPPADYAIPTTMSEPFPKGANRTEMAGALKVEQEQPSPNLEQVAPSDATKDFTRTTGQGAFAYADRPFQNQPRNIAESLLQKTTDNAFLGVGIRAAARSKSTHIGGWHRTAALSLTNARKNSPHNQHINDYVGSSLTGLPYECSTFSTGDKYLQQQTQQPTNVKRIPHDQGNPAALKFKPVSTSIPQTSSMKLSPDGSKRPSPESTKSARSRQGSAIRPVLSSDLSTQNQSLLPQRSRGRIGSSTLALARTSSATSMPSKEKSKKASGTRHSAKEDQRRRKPREASVDDATTVSSKATSRKKTLGSASRADNSRRKSMVTPAASEVAVESEVEPAGAGVRPSTQVITAAGGEHSSREPEAATILCKGKSNLVSSDLEAVADGSSQKKTSEEIKGLKEDHLEGWAPQEDADLISQELQNKLFCHFGASDLSISKVSKQPSEDCMKVSSSSETSPLKRKRKLSEKMKKLKRKKRRKREEETALMKEEEQKSPVLKKNVTDKITGKDTVNEKRQQHHAVEIDSKATVGETAKKQSASDVSPKGIGSRKSSPESTHTVGVTSVTIQKRSLSRSPPKISRPIKLPKYRPVKRLSCKPTVMFPTFSHIPVRMSSPGFLSNRKRSDLLAQYRRWREGMVDPDRPSKIPLSLGFRWTLNSAVVEEWALHCWEPDSGVYMDEDGTWWSSVTDPPQDASVHTSLLADSK